MELTEFYRDGDRVVYSTTVNGVTYYFYDGFNSKSDAIDTTFNKTLKQHILNGIWSQIIK